MPDISDPRDHRLDILVVDDITESRQALCDLAASLGHRVEGVTSGAAALARLERQRPDLVLLDLLMPDLDGFEVTRRIRSHGQAGPARWLPVLVTSSMQGDEHFIHALQQGADDYLLRPVNPELLAAKLRHYGRVLALQARQASLAQRQRDILDNILDPVITLDEQGLLHDVNLAACQRLGPGQPHGLLGQPCEQVLGVTLAALGQGRELRILPPGRAGFPAEVGLSQWHDDGRRRYTVVLRDLTQRRQVERMKDEFLATVSHELRTPLTSILGALGLLAGGAAGPMPPMAKPLAEVARRNGERLSRLIDDLLDLTKLEGDRMVLHPRPAPLLPLLREALAANQGYADRAGVRLLHDFTAGAPALQARLDPDRFLQIMANLLSNAIKHTPAGKAVTVRLLTEGALLCVQVQDEGPGIDPAFRPRMFEKFSQADASDSRPRGGTGLGLYLTRVLVERMDGQIRVDSPPGQGALFEVRLPQLHLPPASQEEPQPCNA